MSDRKNNFEKFAANQPKHTFTEPVMDERGNKDLPPGKKGGEKMKPDLHEIHKQHTFDMRIFLTRIGRSTRRSLKPRSIPIPTCEMFVLRQSRRKRHMQRWIWQVLWSSFRSLPNSQVRLRHSSPHRARQQRPKNQISKQAILISKLLETVRIQLAGYALPNA